MQQFSWSVSECLRSDRQRKTACRPSSNQKYYLWMSSHVHPTKENTYTHDDKLCINPLPLILYYIFTLLLCPNMLQRHESRTKISNSMMAYTSYGKRNSYLNGTTWSIGRKRTTLCSCAPIPVLIVFILIDLYVYCKFC